MSLSTEQLEIWKKKRKRATMVFVYQNLLLGFEYSVTFLTLYAYLRDLVQPSYPKIHYSLASTAYLSGAILTQTVMGRIADKYRCIRKLLTICNVLIIVGNVIYSLPFSPWLLTIGRLIAGSGGSMRAIISGELARCYEPEMLSTKLSIMGMAFCFGFVVGPGINIIFEKVNIWIGKWHITFENMPGLYLTGFFFIAQILVYVFVDDLSKEYDLKAEKLRKEESKGNGYVNSHFEREQIKKEKTIDSAMHNNEFTINMQHRGCATYKVTIKTFEYENNVNNKPIVKANDRACKESTHLLTTTHRYATFTALKKLFSSLDCLVLFSLSFLSMYTIVVVDMWFPLIVLDTITDGSIRQMNIIIIGAGVVSGVVMIILIVVKLNDKRSFYLAVVSTLNLAALISVDLVLAKYNTYQSLNIVMWTLYCVAFGMATINEELFLISCLSKLVHSNTQTFAESVRISISRFGALVALSTSAMLFDYLHIVGCIHIGVVIVITLLLFFQRKTLSNPKVVVRLSEADLEHVFT